MIRRFNPLSSSPQPTRPDRGNGGSDGSQDPQRKRWGFGKLLLVNLAAIALTACLVGWLALVWLDSWTDHGHYEVVPEVKGLTYDVASQRLTDAGFLPELSDSVYDSKTRPGTVLDQNPKVGTKVKEGRVVYLTITSFSPKMVTLPGLNDVSLRQARSVLEGLGIYRINVEYVPSEFKDLVLAVTHDGRRITAGTRLPVTATVTLEVGEGINEYSDSLSDALTMGALSEFPEEQ
ncbi:MAG: PASTA domain-containing protein [Bacteroidales bacterium]|nr:PASTA domain-containing protein [Bacteroidales bacterium]